MDKKGLHKIDNLQLPSGTRRYYVVVAPEGIHPKITVPRMHFQGREHQETSGHKDGEKEMLTDKGEELADEGEEWTDEGEDWDGDDQEMTANEDQDMAIDAPFPAFHYPVCMAELFTRGAL